MPDQPKMTNQKMVRSGVVMATVIAIAKANKAMIKVIYLLYFVIFS